MKERTRKDIVSFCRERPEGRPIIIQPHDFPDHDAIAAAFALNRLLVRFDIPSRIITTGGLQRASLRTFVRELDIPLEPMPAEGLDPEDWVIIVDGCKGNTNITDLPGREVGILDHHRIAGDPKKEIPGPDRFIHIRPELGASCTIVGLYFEELGLPLSSRVSTALLCGISFDTRSFTGKVHADDLRVYSRAFEKGDSAFVSKLLRNNIQFSDLVHFQKLFSDIQIFDDFAYCFFPRGCSQNLLGVLSSFTLSIDSIRFVLLAAKDDNQIRMSVRSEDPRWNAAKILTHLIGDKGRGGGHKEMAGGLMEWDPDLSEKLPENLKTLLMSKETPKKGSAEGKN